MQPRTKTPGIITGGKDGLVKLWKIEAGKLVLEKQYDIKDMTIKSMHPQVKSVQEHPKNGFVLVGTRGGEILEFSENPKMAKNPRLLLKSHFNNELWGLTPHPNKQEFLTVGRDGVLGMWDVKDKRQMRYAKLDCGADAVAYNFNGTILAIGMRNGYLLAVDNNFNPIAKIQNCKKGNEITCIKFSPHDKICAVGDKEGKIKLYDLSKKNALFKKSKVVKKSSSAITHMDFSSDGSWLMVNNASYEVLYFNTKFSEIEAEYFKPVGKHEPTSSKCKNVDWQSQTCTIGWSVQGIFPALSDGTDVNACARSPEGAILATGDDFGKVNLYRYPCPQRSQHVSAIGHSSHVTNVCFVESAKKDKNEIRVVSTGGADLCVFQWKYEYDYDAEQQAR